MSGPIATKSSLCALLLLVAVFPAAFAGAGSGQGGDTTPPKPDLTPRLRQDMDLVLRKGIRATCRTEDNETPVRCRLTALRKGRRLGVVQRSIEPPFYGSVMNLEIEKRKDRRRLRCADPPVMVKLRLRVTDPAGNYATDTVMIELVEGLYD